MVGSLKAKSGIDKKTGRGRCGIGIRPSNIKMIVGFPASPSGMYPNLREDLIDYLAEDPFAAFCDGASCK